MRVRQRVLEATPIVMLSERGAVHVTRGTWRKARSRVLFRHTVAALFACLAFGLVGLLETDVASSMNDWFIGWNALVGFANLIYVMHGWRFADQKTVNFILSVALNDKTAA